MRPVLRTSLVAAILVLGLALPGAVHAASAALFGMAHRTPILRVSPAAHDVAGVHVRCEGRWVAHRGGPVCATPARQSGAEHRRAMPIAQRRVGSNASPFVGRSDDSTGRRRGPDTFVVVRPWSGNTRWRAQRISARLDRRLTVPGAMFYEANAPPVPSPTDIGDWL